MCNSKGISATKMRGHKTSRAGLPGGMVTGLLLKSEGLYISPTIGANEAIITI